jgi:hypothetical protein
MRSRRLTCLLAWLGCPGLALAHFSFEPYATGAYEYNSNIAAVAPGDPANVLLGDPQRDDRIQSTTAGATARYMWSRQTFTASAEGRRFSYDHFSRLDHDEYLLDADLAWHLASLFDGKLDVRREQRMAALNARLSSDLALEEETLATGGLNLQINPEWRLETGLSNRDLDSPQVVLPAYGLRENAGDVAIKYQGAANLTFGMGKRVDG